MGDALPAILWGTEGDKGGAQIAFMNVGGVREDLPMAPKYGEAPGQITFAEAFDIAPFGNLLNTLDLTGQIEQVLEQQYQPIAARRPSCWRSASPRASPTSGTPASRRGRGS